MSTTLSIHGKDIYINEKPTYEGRFWNGHRIEGLLLNSRMVQAIFDDENPETRQHWVYPDTGNGTLTAILMNFAMHYLFIIHMDYVPLPLVYKVEAQIIQMIFTANTEPLRLPIRDTLKKIG